MSSIHSDENSFSGQNLDNGKNWDGEIAQQGQ